MDPQDSFPPEVIESVASDIEQLAHTYAPTRERIFKINPEMKTLKFSIVNTPLDKMLIASDIILQHPGILEEHGISPQEKTEAQLVLLQFKISKYLPDNLVENCYRRAGLTWFEIPDRKLILISYLSESDLANHLMEPKFESGPVDTLARMVPFHRLAQLQLTGLWIPDPPEPFIGIIEQLTEILGDLCGGTAFQDS